MVFVVVAVEVDGERELPNGVFAGGAFGAFLSANERREEQSCQDGDDGDNDEEFNQRKGVLPATPFVPAICYSMHDCISEVWPVSRVP